MSNGEREMANVSQAEASVEPVLCSNGCGFYGNPLTSNMCSKCYKDVHSNKLAAEPPACEPCAPAIARPDSPLMNAAAASPLTAAAAAPAGSSSEEQRVQTDLSRCFSCTKKIGLTGFKCRCGFLYCNSHRYSDQHECPFDYKKMGREQVAKANPLVQAQKITKI